MHLGRLGCVGGNSPSWCLSGRPFRAPEDGGGPGSLLPSTSTQHQGQRGPPPLLWGGSLPGCAGRVLRARGTGRELMAQRGVGSLPGPLRALRAPQFNPGPSLGSPSRGPDARLLSCEALTKAGPPMSPFFVAKQPWSLSSFRGVTFGPSYPGCFSPAHLSASLKSPGSMELLPVSEPLTVFTPLVLSPGFSPPQCLNRTLLPLCYSSHSTHRLSAQLGREQMMSFTSRPPALAPVCFCGSYRVI